MSRVDGTVSCYVRSVSNGYHVLWFVVELTLRDLICAHKV
nr:MAG TPA: hypothetical protein [Caudoviricetes sp.]